MIRFDIQVLVVNANAARSREPGTWRWRRRQPAPGRGVHVEMLRPEIDAQPFRQRVGGGIENPDDGFAVVRQAPAVEIGRADDGVYVVGHHHLRVHVRARLTLRAEEEDADICSPGVASSTGR